MSRAFLSPFLFQGPAAFSSQAAAGTLLEATDPQQLAESLSAVQAQLKDNPDAATELGELNHAIDHYRAALQKNETEGVAEWQRRIGAVLPRLSDTVWWQGIDPFLGARDQGVVFLRRSQSVLKSLLQRVGATQEQQVADRQVRRMLAGLNAFFDSEVLPEVSVHRKVAEIAVNFQEEALRVWARDCSLVLPQPPAALNGREVPSLPLPEAIAQYTAGWGLDEGLRAALLDMLAHAAERSVLAALRNMSWDNRKPAVGRRWVAAYQQAVRLDHLGPAAKLRLIHLLSDKDSFGKTAPLLWPAAQAELDFNIRNLWPAPLQLGRRFGRQVRISRDAVDHTQQLISRPAVLAEDGRYYDHAVLSNGHSVQVWQTKVPLLDLGYDNGRLVGPPHLVRIIIQAAGSVASGQRRGFTLMIIAPEVSLRLRRFFFRYHPDGRILHWSRSDYKLYSCVRSADGLSVERVVQHDLNNGVTGHYRRVMEADEHDLTVVEQKAIHEETHRLLDEKTTRAVSRLPQRSRVELQTVLEAAHAVALHSIGGLSPRHHLAATVLSAYDDLIRPRLTESRARFLVERVNQTLSEVGSWLAPLTTEAPQLIEVPMSIRPRTGSQKKRATPTKPKESPLPWTDDMRAFLGQVIPRQMLNMRKVRSAEDFLRLARIQLRVALQNELVERFRDCLAAYPEQAEAMERELEVFIKGRQQTLSNQTISHLIRFAALATGQALPLEESNHESEPPRSQQASSGDAFRRRIEPIVSRLEELTTLVEHFPLPAAVPAEKIVARADRIEAIAMDTMALYEQLDRIDQHSRYDPGYDAEAISNLEEQLVALEERYEPLLTAYDKARRLQVAKAAQAADEQERLAFYQRVKVATAELQARLTEITAAVGAFDQLFDSLEPPIGAAVFAERATECCKVAADLVNRIEGLGNAHQIVARMIASGQAGLTAEQFRTADDRAAAALASWEAVSAQIDELNQTVATDIRSRLSVLRVREQAIHWSPPVKPPSRVASLGRFFDATLSTPDEVREILINIPPDLFAVVNAYPELALLTSEEDGYRRFFDVFALAADYGPNGQYIVFKDTGGEIRTGRILLRSHVLGRLGGNHHVKTVDGVVYKIGSNQILKIFDASNVKMAEVKKWLSNPASYAELKLLEMAQRLDSPQYMEQDLVSAFNRAHRSQEQSYDGFIALRSALYLRMMRLDAESRRVLLGEVKQRIEVRDMRKRLRAALEADCFLRSVYDNYEQAQVVLPLTKQEALIFFYMMFYPFIRAAQNQKGQEAMDAELRGRLREEELRGTNRVGWTQRFLKEWRRQEGAKYGHSLDESLQSLRVLSTPDQSCLLAGKNAERAAAYLASDQREKTKLSDIFSHEPIGLPRSGWGYRMGRVEDLPVGSYYQSLLSRFQQIAERGGPSRALLEILLRHPGPQPSLESRQELMAILCHQLDGEPNFTLIEASCIEWAIRHAAKLKKVSQFAPFLNSVKSCYRTVFSVDQFTRPIPLQELRGRYRKLAGGAKFLMVVEDPIG